MAIDKGHNDNADIIHLYELFDQLETRPKKTLEKIKLIDNYFPIGVQGVFTISRFNPLENLAITYRKFLLLERMPKDYPSEVELDLNQLGERIRGIAKQIEAMQRRSHYMELIQEQADYDHAALEDGWLPDKWFPIVHEADGRVVLSVERPSMLVDVNALASFLERVADLAGSRKGRGGTGLKQFKSAKDFLIKNLYRMVTSVQSAKLHISPIAAKVHEWAETYTEGEFGSGTMRRIQVQKGDKRKKGKKQDKKVP